MKKIWILSVVFTVFLAGCRIPSMQNEEKSSVGESGAEDFSEIQGYYFRTNNGKDVLIDSAGTLVILSNQSGAETLFDGVTNGDRIVVTVDGIAETYPEEAGCYSCEKQQDGELNDIPDDAIQKLKELGWFSDDQPVEITVEELTQQHAAEYEAQGITLLGSGDSVYSSYFLVSFDRAVTELSLWRIEMDVILNDSYIGSETKCIGSVQSLMPDNQVILAGELGELMPTLGISFVTDKGTKIHDYFAISGKDGSPMLVPYEIFNME